VSDLATSGEADLAACRAILAEGSKSFALASKLLPPRVREPAAALYAFCRVADDAVDDAGADARGALAELEGRLDRMVAGAPIDHPVDRALSRVMAEHGLPRGPIDALLEGFAWDVEGRSYETLEDLYGYGARVAGTVGVAMTILMGPRAPLTLARACDLGVAMQLTNIARDVGEDARNGRLYLPRAELRKRGIDPAAFLAQPAPSEALVEVVRTLLDAADALYRRADAGIALLPRDCRLPIRAARLVYSDIHRSIRRNGFDTVTQRAFVTKPRKLLLVARAWLGGLVARRAPELERTPPLDEVRFLVDGASR
jgi:15-cis-phytoene synthase